MANPNKINGGLGGVGSGPKVDAQVLIQKAIAAILEKAGIPSEIDTNNLGAKAKAVVKDAEAKLGKANGSLPAGDIAQLGRDLREAALKDQVSSLKLSGFTGAAAQLPSGSTPIATKNGDGTFALAGTVGSPGHGLFQLLEKLGFDPRALDANVVDRLDATIRGRSFSLTQGSAVEHLASRLLELSPNAAIRGVASGKTSAASTTTTTSAQTTVRQGAAQAPTTTGKGTSANALNALISNRLTPSENKTAAGEAKKAAVDALLGGVEVKPEVRAEIEKMLDKVLTDPTNPQSPNPGRVLSNAFVELSRATGDREWMKGAAFAHQLQAAIEKVPADQRGGMEQNIAVMAAPLMELAVQTKLSKLTGGAVKADAKPSADALAALTTMLQGRGIDASKLDTDKVLRDARAPEGAKSSQTPPKADKAQSAQTAAPIADKALDGKFDAKAAAKDFVLNQLAVDPKDPNANTAIKGVEDLLTRAGSTEHAAVFKAAFDIFREKTGIEHPYAQHLGTMQLDAQQADALRSQLMLKAAEAAVDPQFFQKAKAALAEQMQQAQMAGMNGMGGMMDGGVGAGIPGFTGPGMPSDEANPMRQMQMSERAMIGASILRDPALTIEDKLFLFMMYMGMFASQDELRKAEELAELDRAEEQRSSIIRKTQTSLQNETQTRGAAKRAAEDAKAKFETVSAQPGATPEAKDAAKREMEATGSAFKMSQEREKALQTDLNQLKGPQQLPKSREQLTMELRRMEDLKRLFQDMVQALLQSFKESTRNTIQQMGR